MIEFYHSMGISSYELFQVILCALGIGMAKTGLGGIGLLVVPIMAGIFGPKESTGILLIILILADIFGVGFYYRHAEISKLIQLAPSTLLGILIGVLVGDRIDAYQFRFVMGTVVIIGAVLMIFQPNNKNNGRVSFFLFLHGWIFSWIFYNGWKCSWTYNDYILPFHRISKK